MLFYNRKDLQDHIKQHLEYPDSDAHFAHLFEHLVKPTLLDRVALLFCEPNSYSVARHTDGTVSLIIRGWRGGKSVPVPLYWAPCAVRGYVYKSGKPELSEVLANLHESKIKTAVRIGSSLHQAGHRLMLEIPDTSRFPGTHQQHRSWEAFMDSCKLLEGISTKITFEYFWIVYEDKSVEVRVYSPGTAFVDFYHAVGYAVDNVSPIRRDIAT